MARPRTFARHLALAALVGGALGCSQDPGSVSGEVTVGGKPLPGGVISFHSEVGNHEVINAPIKDGKYTVSGVPSGNAIVTVGNLRPLPGAAPKAAPAGDGAAAPKAGPRRAAPTGPVPARYGDPGTSGLTIVVQPGDQTFPVVLSP
ncbi:unnamed protein product [Gemmataceae bacterium]|nr:unnamed protein product [Gemmataceae bacterium]VTU00806.1 unnamed protein product [Gemmataceae bacterium]